ncbi:MAG: hypothetical protein ACHQ15_03265, partial [Candidatus Limnocylindrales bacterium]
PLPIGEGRTAARRLAELDDRKAVAGRKAAGVPFVQWAGDTSLMVTYGLEPWYRLMSGSAHGFEWTLVTTNLQPLAEPAPEGVVHGTVSASEPIAVGLTAVTLNAVRTALVELESYRSKRAQLGVGHEAGS